MKTPLKKRRAVAKFQATPNEIAKRTKRVQARRELEKAGLVRKGDGKEINHKVPLSKGGSNDRSNLEVTTRKKNRAHGLTRRGPAKKP